MPEHTIAGLPRRAWLSAAPTMNRTSGPEGVHWSRHRLACPCVLLGAAAERT